MIAIGFVGVVGLSFGVVCCLGQCSCEGVGFRLWAFVIACAFDCSAW